MKNKVKEWTVLEVVLNLGHIVPLCAVALKQSERFMVSNMLLWF